MDIKNTILDAVGEVPIVRLHKVVEPGSAEVLAMCEYLNPAGSIKDRMALHIVREAEKRGMLRPGGTIVENTSGNTGLGLAMAAAVLGYRCVFTMPDKMSQEKVNMLKGFGAEVVITPTDVPGDSPQHYVNTAKRIAAETPGSFYVNQYHTHLNIDAHYHSTAPHLFRKTDGKFDAFVAGVGTGGTISGVGRYIKEHAPNIRVVGVDPLGSVHYHYYYTGTLSDPYVYKVEGIGEDIKCDAFDTSAVDEVRQVDDRQSFLMARRLVREEGLFCGGSSGSTAHAAVELARELGPGRRVVVVLADAGSRYITKHLSDAWMRDHGFLEQERGLGLVEDLLRDLGPRAVRTAGAGEPASRLIGLMREHGVSQVPIVDGTGTPTHIVHEVDLLRGLQRGSIAPDTPAGAFAAPIGGLVYPKARVEELYHIFGEDRAAIVVEHGRVSAIISQIDLIEYLARRRGR